MCRDHYRSRHRARRRISEKLQQIVLVLSQGHLNAAWQENFAVETAHLFEWLQQNGLLSLNLKDND